MRLLRMVVMLAGTIVVVSFSVVNGADVEISFFPLPVAPFDFPVYGVMLFGLALGILTGGLTLWLSTAPMRREWRDLRRRFRAREREERLAREREEAEAAERSLKRREEAEAAHRQNRVQGRALPGR